MKKIFREFVPVVGGYPLSEEQGWFSVLVPEYTINLVANPSVEIAATGYTAVGGSVARVATKQRRGAWSLEVTPTAAVGDGAYYGTVTLLINTQYTFSFDFFGGGGLSYLAYFADTSGNRVGGFTEFTANGDWMRPSITYLEATGAARRLYVVKNGHASDTPFYLDGLQVEAKAYPTTYADGDQIGFRIWQTAYEWTGAVHNSPSIRYADTLSGGREKNLQEDYGLKILGYVGLGMPPMRTYQTDFADLSGALYQRTLAGPRVYSITGSWIAASLSQIMRWRSELEAVLDPVISIPAQPVTIRFRRKDGMAIDIPSVYTGGLSGETDNLFQEKVAPTFVMPDPYPYRDGYDGLELDSYQEAGLFSTIYQTVDGVWDFPDIGVSNPMTLIEGQTFIVADSGNIYLYNIAAQTFEDIGTMTGGTQINFAFKASDSSIYVIGTFTDIDGVANTAHIARYNNGTWEALGTGLNASPGDYSAIAEDVSGNIFVVGAFTQAGGVATTDYVALWNGTVWSSIGSFNNAMHTLAYIPNLGMVIGGLATNINAAGMNYLALRTLGGTLTALEGATSPNGRVIALAYDDVLGRLYAAGAFTTVGGISAAKVAFWYPSSWNALSTGANDDVYRISIAPNHRVVFGSTAATVYGGIFVPGGAAIWDGTIFLPVPIVQSGTLSPFIHMFERGHLFAAGLVSAGGDDLFPATTPVTNVGNSASYPTIRFRLTGDGVATIYYVANETTLGRVYFGFGDDPLVMLSNEIISLEIFPDAVRLYSNIRGNLSRFILAGSNASDFFLLPGINQISILAFSDTDPIEVSAFWKPRYSSVQSIPNA